MANYQNNGWSEDEFYDNLDTEFYGNPKPIDDPKLLKQITVADLGFTVDSVKSELLGLGSDLVDPDTGEPYPDSFYEEMINRAIDWVEQTLDIVIRPRVVSERLDYNQTEYNNYMMLNTQKKPIVQVDLAKLLFNNQTSVDYPDQWIKVTNRFGQVQMQPTALLMASNSNFSGIGMSNFPLVNPTFGFSQTNRNFAPQMIGIKYIAGMLPRDKDDANISRDYYAPYSLIALVAKQASIETLERWGRLILGAGIAGYSTSIDGISSSINSTQSAENTGSTADIKLLQEDMKDYMKALKSYYGYNMTFLS